jgi:hypothetical protein
MVAYTCNPSYLGLDASSLYWRITVRGQAWQKVTETPLANKLGLVLQVCASSYVVGGGRSHGMRPVRAKVQNPI